MNFEMNRGEGLRRYIPGLTFPTEDGVLCSGPSLYSSGCSAGLKGPAEAIHTWKGKHHCAYHSPFDNIYKPCAGCGCAILTEGGYNHCLSCEENLPDCSGHYDDDFTLNSGAGIGEPTYCDGSCSPRN